jgi:hypothetical protein
MTSLLCLNPNECLIRRKTIQRQGQGLARSPSLEISRLLDAVVENEASALLPAVIIYPKDKQ